MEQLKPCPFCGGKDIHIFIKGLDKLKYASVCDNCGARSGRKSTKTEALQEWNRRADNGKEDIQK